MALFTAPVFFTSTFSNEKFFSYKKFQEVDGECINNTKTSIGYHDISGARQQT